MQLIVDVDSRRLSLGPVPPVRGETIPGTLTFMKGGVPFRLPAGTAIQIGVKSWNDPSDAVLAYTTATRPEPDGAPYTFSLSLNTSEMLAKFTAGVTRYDCSIEVKWEVSAGSGTFKKTQRRKYSVDADTLRDTDANPSTMLSRNDFLVTNGTGLLVNVAAGYAANGAFVAAQASLAITNATNYIEVTAAGVASVNTTAFTAGSYPLATVVASAGAITANTDLRAWITPKPSADELPSQTGNSGKYLTTNGTAASWGAVSTGLTVGTTAIASGTSGRILYDNAGVLGELPVGTGVATALAVNVGSAGAFLTSAVTSITGTANEITVTGTTTPTLSLPSALTFTGKTVTGGTFNSPTLFEPSSKNYKILDNQDGTMKGRLTNDFTHVYLDSGGDVFLRSTDFVSSYLSLAHFSASTGRMSLGTSAFLSGKIGFKNATSTGTTTLDSANASANDYTATLQAATGTLALTSDITGGTLAGSFTTLTASATTSLLLGTAGSAVGNIGFRNATSGTTTLAPATGALGTGTVTLPLSGTLAISSGAQTFTGVQSMTSPAITTSITTPSTTFTAFAGATTLATIGGTGATAVVAIPGTLDASNSTTGSVTMAGGLAVAKKIHLGDSFIVTKSQNASTECQIANTNAGIAAVSALRITNNIGSAYIYAGSSNTTTGFEQADNRIAIDSVDLDGVSISARGASADIRFYTDGPANANEKMRLHNSGGLSLGNTTDPGASNASITGTLAVTGVTTLTGLLTANGGITLGDAQNIAFNTTTGTKIGAATTQKLSFWNATPIVQPTTAVASATVAHIGGGTNLKTDDTFDGYTIAQVVKALRNAGLLA
jgi:hypothetical protein